MRFLKKQKMKSLPLLWDKTCTWRLVKRHCLVRGQRLGAETSASAYEVLVIITDGSSSNCHCQRWERSHPPTEASEEQYDTTLLLFCKLFLPPSPEDAQHNALWSAASAHLTGLPTSYPLYHCKVATDQEPTNTRELHLLKDLDRSLSCSKEQDTTSILSQTCDFCEILFLCPSDLFRSVTLQNPTQELGNAFALLFSLQLYSRDSVC